MSRHNQSHTRLYSIWKGMKTRCNNPNCKDYKSYGGRGITICKSWNDNFKTFYNWSLKHGYNDTLTIDRINNDKGYYPSNCRWVTLYVQNRNRKRAIVISYDGKTMNIGDWARELHIPRQTLCKRYHAGWKPPKLFRKSTRPITIAPLKYP